MGKKTRNGNNSHKSTVQPDVTNPVPDDVSAGGKNDANITGNDESSIREKRGLFSTGKADELDINKPSHDGDEEEEEDENESSSDEDEKEKSEEQKKGENLIDKVLDQNIREQVNKPGTYLYIAKKLVEDLLDTKEKRDKWMVYFCTSCIKYEKWEIPSDRGFKELLENFTSGYNFRIYHDRLTLFYDDNISFPFKRMDKSSLKYVMDIINLVSNTEIDPAFECNTTNNNDKMMSLENFKYNRELTRVTKDCNMIRSFIDVHIERLTNMENMPEITPANCLIIKYTYQAFLDLVQRSLQTILSVDINTPFWTETINDTVNTISKRLYGTKSTV